MQSVPASPKALFATKPLTSQQHRDAGPISPSFVGPVPMKFDRTPTYRAPSCAVGSIRVMMMYAAEFANTRDAVLGVPRSVGPRVCSVVCQADE